MSWLSDLIENAGGGFNIGMPSNLINNILEPLRIGAPSPATSIEAAIGRGSNPENLISSPQPTPAPAIVDNYVNPAGSPFGPDRPGEGRMFQGSVGALDDTTTFLKNLMGSFQPSDANAMFDKLSPLLENIMGISDANAANYLNTARSALEPARQEQRLGLANRLGGMGMGGARTARALANLERGYGTEDLGIQQGYQEQQQQGRSMIGQLLANLFGTDTANRQNALLSLAGQLPGLSVAKSQLPASIFSVFNPAS
jgi:hypothetical protein